MIYTKVYYFILKSKKSDLLDLKKDTLTNMQTRNEKIVGESQSKLKNLDLFCKRFGDYLTKQIYADVINKNTSNKKIYVYLSHPSLIQKKFIKKIPSKRPMGYDKGVLLRVQNWFFLILSCSIFERKVSSKF